MPTKRKRLTKQQVADILNRLRDDPSIPYADFARVYGMTVPGIRQLVLRRMPELDPDWTHAVKSRALRVCDECGGQWRESSGYSGPSRRFCPEHRPQFDRDSSGRFVPMQ